jgi:hypothetical protein
MTGYFTFLEHLFDGKPQQCGSSIPQQQNHRFPTKLNKHPQYSTIHPQYNVITQYFILLY